MERCDECQIEYPAELVNTMSGFSPQLGGSFLKSVCGICALKISNLIHGVERKRFDGSTAEEMRKKAIQYRKEHNLA